MSVNIKQNGSLTPIAGMDDQINDSTASSTTTYSSNKINTLLGGISSDKISWSEAKTSVKKNLLKNEAVTTTIHGITFTVNSDGSITANGTATAEGANLVIYSNENESCPYNGCILSGCPSGGSGSKYDLRVSDVTTGSTQDYGNGATISLSNTGKWNASILIRAYQEVSNLVFRPMIRLASIEDDTYVPYIPDNVELDEKIDDLSDAKNFHGLEFHSEYTTPVNANNVTKNGLYHYDNGGPSTATGASATNGALYSNAYSDTTGAEIAQDYANGNLFVRGRKGSAIWSGWRKVVIEYYLDQTATLSTTDPTVYTFTDAKITADSVIDVYADIFGVYPSSVVASAGTCTVTFPKQDTAQSMTCRIYIR